MYQTNTFDRFTGNMKNALTSAQVEAAKRHYMSIGPEFLVLGILCQEESVGVRALGHMNIDPSQVREAVEYVIGWGERKQTQPVELTRRAKKAIEYSVNEARRLGHRYIGTEHLLLGLIRDLDSSVSEILYQQGVTLDKYRQAVMIVLTQR